MSDSAPKSLQPATGDDVSISDARLVSASRTWPEQHARMLRLYGRATSHRDATQDAADDYYNFFLHCFHLRDWLKNDPTVPPEAKKAAEDLVNNQTALMLCADIANGVKHLRADIRPRIDPDGKVSAISAAFQKDAFQVDERVVVIASGIYMDAREIAEACLAAWERFLRECGLM